MRQVRPVLRARAGQRPAADAHGVQDAGAHVGQDVRVVSMTRPRADSGGTIRVVDDFRRARPTWNSAQQPILFHRNPPSVSMYPLGSPIIGNGTQLYYRTNLAGAGMCKRENS